MDILIGVVERITILTFQGLGEFTVRVSGGGGSGIGLTKRWFAIGIFTGNLVPNKSITSPSAVTWLRGGF